MIGIVAVLLDVWHHLALPLCERNARQSLHQLALIGLLNRGHIGYWERMFCLPVDMQVFQNFDAKEMLD